VTNSEGEYLMIKRFGHWDLPKGHREEGEDVETTALREVTEETGIKNQVISSFITVTNHTYFLNGDFCLKSVYWYKMEYDGNILLKPQREEDIVDARWISGEELHSCLESAYGSTKQVFEALLFS
jgi:8-oxo-dGTP pyrophosphatase MutT (NUDIX family)